MENYITRGSVSLWTEIQGHTGPYVLMAAGGPGAASDYLDGLVTLLKDKVRIIRFDQRACGRSSLDYSCDLQTTLEDLEAIRHFYKIDKWILLGHSWGANLCLAYTIQYPQVCQALIYLSGIGAQRNREWRESYHENRKKYPDPLPPSKFPGNDQVNKLGNQSWADYIRRPKLFKDISCIKTRTLIIHGQRDHRPDWPCQQLHHLIKDSKFVSIEGAGHCIWTSHGPLLRDHILSFIDPHPIYINHNPIMEL